MSDIDFAALKTELSTMDLDLQQKSEYHWQVRDSEDKVVADWWPGKGTTMRAAVRGPLCKTSARLVTWLLELMASE